MLIPLSGLDILSARHRVQAPSALAPLRLFLVEHSQTTIQPLLRCWSSRLAEQGATLRLRPLP